MQLENVAIANGPSEEVSFQFFLEILQCQMTGLLLVVCSMMLALQLQMHDHQNWSLNVEPGDRQKILVTLQNEHHQYGTVTHRNATCAKQNIHSP